MKIKSLSFFNLKKRDIISNLAAVLLSLGAVSGICSAQDTDGDGLSDDDEINFYFTNYELPDTDGDGWSDYFEIYYSGTSPISYEDTGDQWSGEDQDMDLLANGDEVSYGTDFADPDTDDDYYSDYDEINFYYSDPLDKYSNPGIWGGSDYDSDGVAYSDEIAYGTNPDEPDTDFDGFSDWVELYDNYTDPLDPNSY